MKISLNPSQDLSGSTRESAGGRHLRVPDLMIPPEVVANPHFLRQRRQRGVNRPEFQPAHERRRQQMRVDPADASAVHRRSRTNATTSL